MLVFPVLVLWMDSQNVQINIAGPSSMKLYVVLYYCRPICCIFYEMKKLYLNKLWEIMLLLKVKAIVLLLNKGRGVLGLPFAVNSMQMKM